MHDLLMRTIIYSVQFSPSSVIFMDFEMILDLQSSQHITKEGCFILFITMRWRDWLIIIYYTSLSLLIWILFFQFELCSTSVVYLQVTHIHLSYGYEFLFFEVWWDNLAGSYIVFFSPVLWYHPDNHRQGPKRSTLSSLTKYRDKTEWISSISFFAIQRFSPWALKLMAAHNQTILSIDWTNRKSKWVRRI